MKNFRITTAALLLSLTLSVANISAQPRQQHKAPHAGAQLSPEKIAEMSTDRLDQQLGLTDVQESKIYAVNLKYAQERKVKADDAKAIREAMSNEELKAKRSSNGKAAMEAYQSSRKAQMTEIMSVLNDTQKIDYALMLSESCAKQKANKGKGTQHKQKKGYAEGNSARKRK